MTVLKYQKEFIEFALQQDVLRFGQFTLKSGRVSPYFFNAGLFHSGAALVQLGQSYAAALEATGWDYDLLFGPAYKGITLASATACMLAEHHHKPTPFAFNRKEVKDHGEGGQLVGASMAGQKVVIVDDVITAGTAIREVLPMIEQAGGQVAGILLALDRQERGQGERSAIQEVEQDLGIPVTSIIAMQDLIAYIETERADLQQVLSDMQAYRHQYGV